MKAEIDLWALGGGSVHLDGIDVGRGVTGGSVRFGVHDVARLNLDLQLIERSTITGDVEVTVPEHTHALLVQLGWTPPDAALRPSASASSADQPLPPSG